MNDVLLQVLVRLVPSLAFVGLGFYAAADRKTRERWVDLLYQAGSLRPDQKTDPARQRGVRVPFFVIAVGLLFLPITYYMHATRGVEVRERTETLVRPSAPKATATPAASAVPGASPAATTSGSPAPAPTEAGTPDPNAISRR